MCMEQAAIINVTSYTCAFPAINSENVCTKNAF